MDEVAGWFERRGGIPLKPPLNVREYEPLVEDADGLEPAFDDSRISGLAFGLEYMDTRGWVSTRTIRCLAYDPLTPASIRAYCTLRKCLRVFRVGRIVSIFHFRSGKLLSEREQFALLVPYLAEHAADPDARAMRELQKATKHGVFALLQLAMAEGRLAERPREIVLGYVASEAEASGCALPSSAAVELWADNLSPPLDAVLDAVTRLLTEKDKLARLLPWLLKVMRSQGTFAANEESARELITAIRWHYRRKLMAVPSLNRASA